MGTQREAQLVIAVAKVLVVVRRKELLGRRTKERRGVGARNSFCANVYPLDVPRFDLKGGRVSSSLSASDLSRANKLSHLRAFRERVDPAKVLQFAQGDS